MGQTVRRILRNCYRVTISLRNTLDLEYHTVFYTLAIIRVCRLLEPHSPNVFRTSFVKHLHDDTYDRSDCR